MTPKRMESFNLALRMWSEGTLHPGDAASWMQDLIVETQDAQLFGQVPEPLKAVILEHVQRALGGERQIVYVRGTDKQIHEDETMKSLIGLLRDAGILPP